MKKRGLKFTRYADDCIIVVKSEKAANRVMESITKFIEKKLGLKVNAEKSKVAKPNEIKYLGFGFYEKNNTWRPKPHLKSLQKFERKLKYQTRRSFSVSLERRIDFINPIIRGWINYFRIADMESEVYLITCHLRRRIRCCIWKQWKTISTRIINLKKLGVCEKYAKLAAFSRKSYWRTASNHAVHQGISNERLRQKGFNHAR